jgi:hypothetical protein
MPLPHGSMNHGFGWLVLGALLQLMLPTAPTSAAEVTCAAGDVACLLAAIHAANATGKADTITLAAGTYRLTAVNHDTDGPTGLPSITTALTLRGAGARSTVLERAATGVLTLEGLTLRGGDAAITNAGGGVWNQGTLTITRSTLSGNVANGSGGSISTGSGGSLTITNSTLRGNVANYGGGLDSFGSFGTTITNSTLHGNVANGSGGGISLAISTLTLTNSTLHGNMASQGGGISIGGGGVLAPPSSASLGNTILAQNAVPPTGTGPDCAMSGGIPGQATSQGHNLVGDPTGCNITLAASDLTGDPGLGAFTDAGLPGQGYVPLLPASRAVDAGDPAACPAADQLGQLRVTPCDIGAVEFAPVTVTLGLNQATVRAGETLRVGLGVHNPGPPVTADAYLGVLRPDGVSVFWVTRLDADPRTFAPLAAAFGFPPGLEVPLLEDFFVHTVTEGESVGPYAVFTLLTPAGAFADGRVDAGDLVGLTRQPFTVRP